MRFFFGRKTQKKAAKKPLFLLFDCIEMRVLS